MVLTNHEHILLDMLHKLSCSGAPFLGREAESVGVIEPREEKAPGRPHFRLLIVQVT